MARAKTLPLATLKEEARLLERTIVALRIATAESLDPHRPGGAENPDPGPHGWLRFYGRLHRVHGRAEEGPVGVPTLAGLLSQGAAEGLGLQTLTNAPEEVRLTPLAGERPRVVKVYPKSLGALVLIAELDERLQWLALRADPLRTEGKAEHLSVLERIDEEMVKLLATITWIVTHPGPGLPWTREPSTDGAFVTLDTGIPVPPDAIRQLDPVDTLAIQHAHLVVNGLRVELVRRLYLGRRTPDAAPGAVMLQWTTLVGHAAIELKTKPAVLTWDWSLGEFLQALTSSSEAQRVARERAGAGADGGG